MRLFVFLNETIEEQLNNMLINSKTTLVVEQSPFSQNPFLLSAHLIKLFTTITSPIYNTKHNTTHNNNCITKLAFNALNLGPYSYKTLGNCIRERCSSKTYNIEISSVHSKLKRIEFHNIRNYLGATDDSIIQQLLESNLEEIAFYNCPFSKREYMNLIKNAELLQNNHKLLKFEIYEDELNMIDENGDSPSSPQSHSTPSSLPLPWPLPNSLLPNSLLLRSILERNRNGYNKCHRIIMEMELIYRYRYDNFISNLPRELFVMILEQIKISKGTSIWT